MKILAYVEHTGGQLRSTGLEALSCARRLADASGGSAHAILVGHGLAEQAASLAAHGADSVELVDDERLARYAPEAHLRAICQVAEGAAAVLLSATSRGRDLTARVAARLGTSALADVTELTVEGGALQAVRPMYAGKVNATVKPTGATAVVSLRPKVFGITETAAAGTVNAVSVAFEDKDFRSVTVKVEAGEGKRIELTEADAIVAGGRGIKGACDPDDTAGIAKNFELLEALAAELDAAVGASRAVVDAGWRDHADQVGQTGKTVNPTLYIACAISGAIQHLAGMRRSRHIIAINKDPEAPIFGHADLGVVGDMFEVVPALTEAIRAAKG